MDWLASFIPSLVPQSYTGYFTAAVTICAALATVIPPQSSGALALIYKFVNFVALNFGQAKNATAENNNA